MQIDEARCDHQTRDIQHLAAAQRPFGDLHDPVATDPDVAYTIEARLRVDDPTTLKHEVVRLTRPGLAEHRRIEPDDEHSDQEHPHSEQSIPAWIHSYGPTSSGG